MVSCKEEYSRKAQSCAILAILGLLAGSSFPSIAGPSPKQQQRSIASSIRSDATAEKSAPVSMPQASAEQAARDESPIANLIYTALTTKSSIAFDNITIATAAMKPVYAGNGYAAFWVDEDGLTQKGRDALDAIAKANAHGINPSRYGTDVIDTLNTARNLENKQDARTLAAMDILISHAVTRYMKEMASGTTDSQRRVRGGFADATPDASQLFVQAVSSQNVSGLLQEQAAPTREYTALQELLAQYQKIAENGGWEKFPAGKPIKPNQQDARIPALRRILAVTGDYDGTGDAESNVYDENLQKAIARFQERHGLNVDGTIGASTQKQLATPVSLRLQQIVASMERMRWMPRNLGDKYVLINMPGFTLHGYDKGQQAITMRVIIGKPHTRTPMFSNVITDVVFNPTWSAPASIVRGELLPKLRKNPGYFVRAGFTVFKNGQAVDPHSVDASSGSFQFRQRAGSGNALGKIKFNLPDNDSIYLHSTAQPALFGQEKRALSHGCIRLEKPRDMAHFILGAEADWDAEKIERTYDSSASRSVEVAPVPVHLVYWTAWVDANGVAHFHDDIYNKDEGINARIAPAAESLKLAGND